MADTYGYASEGESFTLTDPREAWVLEMIGKGPNQHGAVWMAVKIPGKRKSNLLGAILLQ